MDTYSEPLISVIVPVFNVEKYLPLCIESLVRQTYPNLEIILVDDGSTDNSSKICDTWKEKCERIVVIHQKNAGVSTARNVGIKHARGDFIGFVDSDDTVDEKMFEVLMNQLRVDDSDLVVSGYSAIKKLKTKNRTMKATFVSNWKDDPAFFIELYDNMLFKSPCNKLYKAEFIDLFDVDMKMGEDALFNMGYFAKIKAVSVVPDILYFYLSREGSATNVYRLSYFNDMIKKQMAFSELLESCFVKEKYFGWMQRQARRDINSSLIAVVLCDMSKEEKIAIFDSFCEDAVCQKLLEKYGYFAEPYKMTGVELYNYCEKDMRIRKLATLLKRKMKGIFFFKKAG